MIPGKTETLRISGIARIVRVPDMLASMAVRGQGPILAIVVDVQVAIVHCSKCMIRSKLWQSQDWPSLDGLPRLAKTMVDAGKPELSDGEIHEIVANDERERLY
jgi:predicted pyridoxine 5'-phosphate oxidase superfamily flavin-nucleotide-binding protein